MSQRDRYEPGVPCWVTTMQPGRRGGRASTTAALFGWEYMDGGGSSTARLRGRDVAAIAPIAPGFEPPPAPAWITQVSVETAEGAAERVERAGGSVIAGPLEFDIGRMIVVADPGRRRAQRMGAADPPRRAARQRAWRVGDEPARHRPTPRAPPRSTPNCSAGRRSPSGPFTMFRLPGYVGGEADAAGLARGGRRDGAGGGRARAGPSNSWVDDVDAAVERSEAQRRHHRGSRPADDPGRALGRDRRPGRRRRSRSATWVPPAG